MDTVIVRDDMLSVLQLREMLWCCSVLEVLQHLSQLIGTCVNFWIFWQWMSHEEAISCFNSAKCHANSVFDTAPNVHEDAFHGLALEFVPCSGIVACCWQLPRLHVCFFSFLSLVLLCVGNVDICFEACLFWVDVEVLRFDVFVFVHQSCSLSIISSNCLHCDAACLNGCRKHSFFW